MGWTMEQLFRDGIMPREMCCPKKQEYKDTISWRSDVCHDGKEKEHSE